MRRQLELKLFNTNELNLSGGSGEFKPQRYTVELSTKRNQDQIESMTPFLPGFSAEQSCFYFLK